MMVNLDTGSQIFRTVLMADDDPDDCDLFEEVFREDRPSYKVHFVSNGEELLDYLCGRGVFRDRLSFPLPDLILLDLNMPKMNGHEALIEIKADPMLRQIPIVLLTTSRAELDVHRAYNVGANSFVTKPGKFQDFVDLVKELNRYWFDFVILPNVERNFKARTSVGFSN